MASNLRLLYLNDVRLVGRLTRDPELRFTAKGTAAVQPFPGGEPPLQDAATGEWKDDPSFIPVVVWKEAGQRCGDRLKKGSPVYVEGRLKSKSWEPRTARSGPPWKWTAAASSSWRRSAPKPPPTRTPPRLSPTPRRRSPPRPRKPRKRFPFKRQFKEITT